MNISFLCLVPVFSNSSRLEKVLKFTFVSGFILMILSFLTIAIIHGLKRDYRFEIVIISINWPGLIIAGIMLAWYFKRRGEV